MHSCAVCGKVSPTPRCPTHTAPPNQPRRHGRHGQRLRQAVIQRDGYTCHICGQPIDPQEPWHLDHIVALSEGGTNDMSNLGPAHRACNLSKGPHREPHRGAT